MYCNVIIITAYKNIVKYNNIYYSPIEKIIAVWFALFWIPPPLCGPSPFDKGSTGCVRTSFQNVILSRRDVSGRTEKECEESVTESHFRYFFDGTFFIFPSRFVVAVSRQRSFGCFFVRPLKGSGSG